MEEIPHKKHWYPVLFGALFILIGSVILFLPLLETFMTNEAISISSYALINFSGYLFVTMTFVELLFVRLVMLGTIPYLLVPVAVLTALAGLTIDYLTGYFFSKAVLTKFFTEHKIEKYKDKIKKHGNKVIFVFNVLPLSSPLLTLAAGLIRYKYKDIMLYSFLGLIIKYSTIAIFISVFYL